MFSLKNKSPHLIPLIIITIFSLVTYKALFHQGLYTAHDIWHQVARLYHYTEALKDGQLIPGWISQLANGYGYPLFIFSYHLPWMIGAPLVLMGISIPVTIKTLFMASVVASGLAMYALGFEVWKKTIPSIATAIVYIVAPYHFLTIFVSAAIGVAFQFVWVPLIILGILRIIKGKSYGIHITAISLAAASLSHLMTIVMISPIILLFCLVTILQYAHKNHSIKNIMFAGVLAVALSAFYVFPLAEQMNQIKASEVTAFADLYQSNFVHFKQIVYSKWGYGPIISNAKDGEISFQLGIAQWIAIVSFAVLFISSKKIRQKSKKISPYIVSFLVSIWLMTDKSVLYWQWVTKFINQDYPFRLLLIAVIMGSLIAGWVVYLLPTKNIKIAALICFSLIAVYTNRNHWRVNLYTDIPVEDYVDAETTTNTFHEYLPLGADRSLLNSDTDLQDALKPVIIKTNQLTFNVPDDSQQNITLRHFDYPGIKITNNQSTIIPHSSDSHGRVVVSSASQIGNQFILKHQSTHLAIIGKMISLLSLVGLTISSINKRKKHI